MVEKEFTLLNKLKRAKKVLNKVVLYENHAYSTSELE